MFNILDKEILRIPFIALIFLVNIVKHFCKYSIQISFSLEAKHLLLFSEIKLDTSIPSRVNKVIQP